jgi:hypothetical protein
VVSSESAQVSVGILEIEGNVDELRAVSENEHHPIPSSDDMASSLLPGRRSTSLIHAEIEQIIKTSEIIEPISKEDSSSPSTLPPLSLSLPPLLHPVPLTPPLHQSTMMNAHPPSSLTPPISPSSSSFDPNLQTLRPISSPIPPSSPLQSPLLSPVLPRSLTPPPVSPVLLPESTFPGENDQILLEWKVPASHFPIGRRKEIEEIGKF